MEVSETFAFWDCFARMVCVLKEFVRADHEGNWELHLHNVQAALALFAGCDRINYFRWASVYLEDKRKLQADAPTVYENFKAGKFVVKRSEGSFYSVGADNQPISKECRWHHRLYKKESSFSLSGRSTIMRCWL